MLDRLNHQGKFAEDYVLVPGSDGFSDGPRRVREVLDVLARVEGRSREDIATDIGSPQADACCPRAPGPR